MVVEIIMMVIEIMIIAYKLSTYMHMLCSMRVMVVHHAVKAFMLLHRMRVLGGEVSGDEGVHCCCTTTTTTTTTTGVCPGSHQIQS